MKVSVIISVYNHFEWLRLILDALRRQSVGDFEIVIADDGSSPETVSLIRDYIAAHPEIDIIHSWHPDEGWRKNIALNEAVRRSGTDYLIFIDGDCIPHPRFVEDHTRLAERGRVVAGRRVDLPKKVSEKIEKNSVLSGDYSKKIRNEILISLFSSFGESFKVLKRLVRFPIKDGKVLGMKRGGILGCNFSLYKEDFYKVNGFDERYLAPGTGEDTDIDVRLANAGVTAMKVSRAALMYHRSHPRLPMDSPQNREILRSNRENHVTFTPYGINS